MKAEHRRWVIFAVLVLCLTLALRAPLMQRSMVDWDESVYLLVASSVLDGHLPYVEIFSHKQPFLYLVFAASFIAKDPVVGMRILGSVCVAVTALFLAVIARRILGGWIAPIVAVVLYILGMMSSGGLATNTEVVFAPFVAGAFAVLAFLPRDRSPTGTSQLLRFAFGGLLGGLAVQIKLVAVFEVLALAAAAAMSWWPPGLPTPGAARLIARRLFCFGLGVLAPAAVALFVFWYHGALDEYLFTNFGFNFDYTGVGADRMGLARAALNRQASQGNLLVWTIALLGLPFAMWWGRTESEHVSVGGFRDVVVSLGGSQCGHSCT